MSGEDLFEDEEEVDIVSGDLLDVTAPLRGGVRVQGVCVQELWPRQPRIVLSRCLKTATGYLSSCGSVTGVTPRPCRVLPPANIRCIKFVGTHFC